jgi:hypothetical protein
MRWLTWNAVAWLCAGAFLAAVAVYEIKSWHNLRDEVQANRDKINELEAAVDTWTDPDKWWIDEPRGNGGVK